jgi:hypothetical protein
MIEIIVNVEYYVVNIDFLILNKQKLPNLSYNGILNFINNKIDF